MDLTNKIAIVTGGTQGIGIATAEMLASKGATVVIGARSITETDGLRQREYSGAGSLFERKLDVSSEESVNSFVKIVGDKFGRIDILVNNAGISRNAMPIEEIPRENWEQMFNINMYGGINCINAVIPYMKAQKSGKIVNLTSVAAEVGGIRTEASYGASKAANICLTMSLAKYLGPYNVNVNAVSPGIIDTPMTDGLESADVSSIPLGRVGRPEDVANAIYFLSSGLSDYLTGVVVDVNGGMYMR